MSTANMKNLFQFQAWRYAECFSDYLLNKVQKKKD